MAKSSARPTSDDVHKPTTAESIRETVDSIVIAFVLAFLFRTFEAEAFVIPTGSMALTLMGDHKDLVCAKCQYPYKAGASDESPNNNAGDLGLFQRNPNDWNRRHAVISAECPNCRYRMSFDEERTKTPPPPSFKGDRILVTKYSYDFTDPQRYDVVVFKNPSQAKINYIKRVVGLPNEEVLLYRGDVYVRPIRSEDPFRIARKSPEKALAMAQVVYDQDYVYKPMHERGWPQRWVSEMTGNAALWKQSDDWKSFSIAPAADDESWLRYQHYVPMSSEWAVLDQQSLDPQQRARVTPQLVTDFCEYNTEYTRVGRHDPYSSFLGMHWVGDIGVECTVEFLDRKSDDAEAVLEIVEGGRAYQCRIRAATGDVALSISGADGYRATAEKAVVGRGPHKLRFANVDDRLLLWVNGKPVKFAGNTNFQSVEKLIVKDGDKQIELSFDGESDVAPLVNLIPQRQDVNSPIGIAAKGVGLNVSHLRIVRDDYYIAVASGLNKWRSGDDQIVHDYPTDVFLQYAQERSKKNLRASGDDREALLHDFMSDVDLMPERFLESSFVGFEMEADQFFMLGDNSPRSLDGRLWSSEEHFVKRELLIGKALFVYWPHGWDTIPFTKIPLPSIPILGNQYTPDLTRMRMIR
jgi:signal peptidase I